MMYVKCMNASKRYLSKAFDIEIHQHDFYVISGENGSGKSTLTALICGFINPDIGIVEKHIKTISYLPEKVMLPPWIKVYDYLKTMSTLKKHPLDYHLLHDFDIPLDQSIHTLSKGNQQKIGLVVSLMTHAPLIICDEPFSGLDDQMKDCLVDYLFKRHQAGATFLIATHEPHRLKHLWTKHLVLS